MNTQTTLTVEDLKRFCSTDDTRPMLCRPFSQGPWTYATQGTVIIRVPRMADVPDYSDSPNAAGLFTDDTLSGQWRTVPSDIPSVALIACGECGGKGTHECSCGHEHQCGSCMGEGKVLQWKGECVTIGRHVVSHLLLHLIKTLPGVEICESAKDDLSALGVRFDGGGEGRLMPMKKD